MTFIFQDLESGPVSIVIVEQFYLSKHLCILKD